MQLIWFVGEGRAFQLQYKELEEPLRQPGNPATTSLEVTSIADAPPMTMGMASAPATGAVRWGNQRRTCVHKLTRSMAVHGLTWSMAAKACACDSLQSCNLGPMWRHHGVSSRANLC